MLKTQISVDFHSFFFKYLRSSAFYQRLSAFFRPLLNSYEFESPPSDGPACYRSRLIPELMENGSVSPILVIADDITALKQTEQALNRRIDELTFLYGLL
jgi:hypothetical protein